LDITQYRSAAAGWYLRPLAKWHFPQPDANWNVLVNIQSRSVMHLSPLFCAALVIAGTLGPLSVTRPPDDVAAIIKRQSQEFSDASATGDSAMFARLLDDRVIFMNETGAIATKKDILSGGKPPAGMTNTLVQSDYAMQLRGNVAVTSFTDNSTVSFAGGQTAHAKYRSTDVLLSEKGGWKMISSQTLTLPDDPPRCAAMAATRST
jgi:ketosteroid isomerase-like protein